MCVGGGGKQSIHFPEWVKMPERHMGELLHSVLDLQKDTNEPKEILGRFALQAMGLEHILDSF